MPNLTKDDALSHFWFRKVHLQEVADKLWPRLLGYLVGLKLSIVLNNLNYSAPYETLSSWYSFAFRDLNAFARTWNPSSAIEEATFQQAFAQWLMPS